ncbi:MAG: hypothetical protein BWY47_01366 [Bacteroidetes bacterium ADurb.Bin302]|nr:MAG: hypothetical protein BWY47_01366 [Bacteroidetes bacterium ADurb.Bin302]
MTIDEAITVLELHNSWRKGADIEMQSPTKIGMAIDMVLCELKSLRKEQSAVMRSVYAVYPDAERLDIGQNRLSAIFRYKDHAEEFAKSKWGQYYIIEEMSSEHFA